MCDVRARPDAAARFDRMAFLRRDDHRVWVGGPVPPGSAAITLGSTIIVRPGAERSPYVMRHELVHVRQWRRLRAPGFIVRYLGSYVLWRLRRKGHSGAYRRIPLEVEADWVARRSLGTAVGTRRAAVGSGGTPR